MTLLLDAGAFFAVERGDRTTAALVKCELLAARTPRTHGGIVAEIWRGGSGRQASVARLLAATHVVSVDAALGKRSGVLLGRARATDTNDAAVVLLAADGDTILTSDPEDLHQLAATADLHVDLVQV